MMTLCAVLCRKLASFLHLLIWATALHAAPQQYYLDGDASVVGFTYYLNGVKTEGQMPVHSAELFLDLRNIERSRIDVTLNPQKAVAGFVFATEALKGARVLDVRNHPTIRFVAREITGSIHKAQVTGDLTVRGISKPVTLSAQLFRQRGTKVGDLDNLSILLTGKLDRTEFGATGYQDFVGRQIDLTILARVRRGGSQSN
ncbi:YceI family protein [Shimia sagamensis]|nr:YceI family protein [Shimia sagamensis]